MKKVFFANIWFQRFLLWFFPQEKINFYNLFFVALQKSWTKHWLKIILNNKEIKNLLKNPLIYNKQIELKNKLIEFDILMKQFDSEGIKLKKIESDDLIKLISLGKIEKKKKNYKI